MNRTLRRLAAGPMDEAAIRRFLRRNTFPLQEGYRNTFVYFGAAEKVKLRHWIYGLPTSQALAPLGESDLWHLTLELPQGSRIEYKLEVVADGARRLIRDPLNPLLAHDPFGANSVCHVKGYATPDWTLPDPHTRRGEIEVLELSSRIFGDKRRVRLYRPPRFRRSRQYPLLVVHDGDDYLRYASLDTVLDNLIDRHEVAPLVVALTQSPERLTEYGADPRHARFLSRELVPRLEKLLPLEPDASRRGLLGASFGAVAALSTAWRFPKLYGRLLLQSGSFAFTDIGESRRGPAFAPVVEFMNGFRQKPGRPAERVYVSCGVYESLIYENRSLVPVLQDTGMQVRYTESKDGHNWENWRDRLREGLSFLFPGPLMMVYE